MEQSCYAAQGEALASTGEAKEDNETQRHLKIDSEAEIPTLVAESDVERANGIHRFGVVQRRDGSFHRPSRRWPAYCIQSSRPPPTMLTPRASKASGSAASTPVPLSCPSR